MSKTDRNRFRIMVLRIGGVVVIIVVVVLSSLYVIKRSGNADSRWIRIVGKIIELPPETPQVLVISDVAAARGRNPIFFRQAKNKDVLLIYQNLSILYNPKLKKIINLQFSSPFTPIAPTKPLKIAFRYNGDEELRAQELKTKIEHVSTSYVITEISKSDVRYPGDVVYIVNSDRLEDIALFARLLGGSAVLQDLEKGEATSGADLIVAFQTK